MKNTPLKICNTLIQPGETVSLALPMPEIFTYTPMYMPIKVIHGKTAGPRLLIIAAVHGDELNGIEIINRLLSLSMLKRLRGTIIAVPVFNIYGFLTKSRYLADGLELDKYFPGSASGTHAARLAHLFATEIFNLSDYCIDLRTGQINYINFPQIHINTTKAKNVDLAINFGAPVIFNKASETGSIGAYAESKNIPYLLYEAGEALRFNKHAIKSGVIGLINTLRTLEMLPPQKTSKVEKKNAPFIAKEFDWIRSPKSGVAYTDLKLGKQVIEQQLISVIKDPFGTADKINLYSPHTGIVVGRHELPIVHEGEGLIQIAFFEQHERAAEHLESWHDKNVQHA